MVIYACVRACVQLCVGTRARVCVRIYVSVIVDVVVVGTSCEVSCVIFCLVVGYGGRLNALAVHAGAILCSVVSQPPLPCLSMATDHTGLTSEFGSSYAAPSVATWALTLSVSETREAGRKL